MNGPFEDTPITDADADTTAANANASSSSPRLRDNYDFSSQREPGSGGVAVSAPRVSSADDPSSLVKYNCSDCASEQRFPRGVMMRCTECGGRMFYKQRTQR